MNPTENSAARNFYSFTRGASLLGAIVGAASLLGWCLNLEALKSVFPGLATMKANTALAFILISVTLGLKLRGLGARASRAADLCALAAALIAALTLFEYAGGRDLGIDQLLFIDSATAAAAHPGRMAVATAIGFLILAAALLLLDRGTAKAPHLSQVLASFTGLMALATLIGYAYDVQTIYRISVFSSVALHTAALFFVLCAGILCARPERAPIAKLVRFRFALVPQVVTVVVLVVFLVGGLISSIMLRRSQSILREQIIANNLASVDLAAELAHRYIEGTQMAIRLFARSPFIEQSVFSGKFTQATAELQEFLQLNPRVNGCSLLDVAGVYRATGTASSSSVGTSSREREWYQRAMASGRAYLGLPTMTRSTARPVVPYVVPIRTVNAEIKGFLLCGISLAALNDAFASFQSGPSARASLTDWRGTGVILAHVDRQRVLTAATGRNEAVSRMLRGERGAMETSDSAGNMNLVVYAPVPDLPWGAMILQPSQAAFAPIYRAARQSMLFTAILLVFSAVVSGLFARRVTRPLMLLRAAAGRLGAGELTTRLNIRRQDEVGDLARTFDQMAAALAERTAELEAAHEELQSQYLQVREANRFKSEFLANMSHELRTPLNAVIGFAQLLHDGKVGAIEANQKEYLNDILTSADHLLQLINDVLDLAKVESGKLEFEPEPVNLLKLITEVRNILQPLAAAKHLSVDVEVAREVAEAVIDPAKLKQVLYNYLSNAIKFTPERGRITVRAKAEGPDWFRLAVEDTGIGIREEEIAKLFVAFQQLDSSTSKRHQGTGLGLALTKKIVEAQGGSVGVHSARGQGSVFFAILPLVASVEIDSATPPVSSPRADEPAILIVEDSEADLRWLARVLSDAGYSVENARTGAEAIAKLKSRDYAAVLLDLILPDAGGWDILHAIRSDGHNQNIPVIVVTVVAEKGVSRGFPVQDYLVKPVQAKTLMDSLRAAAVLPRPLSRRILVVDDDTRTLKLSKIALEAAGYEVACHPEAASALEEARCAKFAAVVLDLLMPQMDGFQFLDRFRRIDGCRHTPVIVWTNKDVTGVDMQRLKASAHEIALKGRDGIETVLKMLQRQAPAGATAPVAQDNGEPTYGQG